MNKTRVSMVASLGLLTLLLGGSCASSPPIIERYEGQIVNITGGPTGMAHFTLGIYGWTSDADRKTVRGVLETKGPEEIQDELAKLPEVGFVKVGNSMGYRLQFAAQFEDGGRRKIIMATDRPISFGELWRGARLKDYDISILELDLDSEGNGRGSLAVAVELGYNETTKSLIIKNYSIEPARLENIKKAK